MLDQEFLWGEDAYRALATGGSHFAQHKMLKSEISGPVHCPLGSHDNKSANTGSQRAF